MAPPRPSHPSAGRSGAVWRRTKATVLRRDGHTCRIRWDDRCTVHATTVDHIVPLARGGHPTDPANLQAACLHCNSAKSDADVVVRTSQTW